jgi:hypothetical protein
MRKLYVYNTKAGPFFIAEHNGRFHPLFQDESLGSYKTAQQAVDDLTGGHTVAPPKGVKTELLAIPHDLTEWERLRLEKM